MTEDNSWITGLPASLLPCPFCGSEPYYGGNQEYGFFIQCNNPVCSASSKLVYALKDDPWPILKEAWNDRAVPEWLKALERSWTDRSQKYAARTKGGAFREGYVAGMKTCLIQLQAGTKAETLELP